MNIVFIRTVKASFHTVPLNYSSLALKLEQLITAQALQVKDGRAVGLELEPMVLNCQRAADLP